MLQKNAAYNIAGNVVFLFAQWLMAVAAVRLSGYHDAGLLSVAVTLTGVFYIVSNYNMRGYQTADIDGNYRGQDYILARFLTSAAGLALCAVFLLFFGYGVEQNAVLLFYMLYKTCESISDGFYGIYQKQGRFSYICVSMCVKGVLCIAGFAVSLALGVGLAGSVFVMAATIALVTAVYDYPRVRGSVDPFFATDAPSFKRVGCLLADCFPLMLVMLSQPILQAIPRIVFERSYSTELFGIYSSIAMPCAIITIFVSCAILPYVPYFAALYKDKRNGRLLRSAGITAGTILAFSAAALVGALFLGEWALVLLFGEGVRTYVGVFPYIIASMTCSAFIMAFNGILMAMRKSAALTALSFGCCAVCAVVSGYFIGEWGMYGIAYAMLTAQGAQVIAMAALIVRYARKNA